jgi:hypothetical protein
MSSQWPGTASSRKAMNTIRWPRRRTATASTSPGVGLLDLDPEDAGSADRWPPGPLDAVGNRRPQAGVADPLQLAGRAQPGLNLTDGQRHGPGGGGWVGQGAAGTSAGLLSKGEFLVGEVGTQQRGGHGRLPGRGQAGCLPVPEGTSDGAPARSSPASTAESRNRSGVVAAAAGPGLKGLGWR